MISISQYAPFGHQLTFPLAAAFHEFDIEEHHMLF
jgi:hypothetical protein